MPEIDERLVLIAVVGSFFGASGEFRRREKTDEVCR